MVAAPSKRLLLVSYYFPPITSSGVFRPLRWSKYLAELGWAVTVLTVSDRVRLLKDPDLALEVPDSVHVVRAPTLEPRTLSIALERVGLGGMRRLLERWCMLPDDQRGWRRFAARRGLSLLEREPHDVILSTSSPYTAHLVGRDLHRGSGVPWVVDLRDEWSLHPDRLARYPTRWHRELDRRTEIETLGEAQMVISVSQPYLERHRSLAPGEPASKFRLLTNGYDGRHFSDPPAPAPDRFRIVYTGISYVAEIGVFLEGLRRAFASGRVNPESTDVSLVGHGLAGLSVDGLPAGVLTVSGHRPYREIPGILEDAAVLLLAAAPIRGHFPAKLFPYLAAGRPILALGNTDDVTAELIRRTRSGIAVGAADADGVAGALADLFERWRAGRLLPDQDRSAVREFSAERQAAVLAGWLEAVADQPSPAKARS